MPTIAQFDPTFKHEEWIDNVDRVMAGGPNGFNVRFNALQADLVQMAEVVKTLDLALQSRPQAKLLIETNVRIPALVAGGGGGVRDVTLEPLLPVTSHAFHQISVRPEQLNAQVWWTELAFRVDNLGGPPTIARMLRLQHSRPQDVDVTVRVLRIEHLA